MSTRFNWKQNDHRKELVDSTSGKSVVYQESAIGGYSVYWSSRCDIKDFTRYLSEIHRRGKLVTGSEGSGPHLLYHFLQSEDDDKMSPKGEVDRMFPTVEEMLDFAQQEVDQRGRFLRVDLPTGDYIWDHYEIGLPGRLVGVINCEGVPIDNVVELFRLTSSEVDDGIITALQNEPPPTASPEQQ